MLSSNGALSFDPTPESITWAQEALAVTETLSHDPKIKAANLRHGATWFVGVDILPNTDDGAINGVPLQGPWKQHLPYQGPLHKAQVSIIYPGYPKRDPEQSEANHSYRLNRYAAHMDGLLPEGPNRRRFPREYHAYILGIHLSDCAAAPTVYWPGSHEILQNAMRTSIGSGDPETTDVTDAYHAARREIFDMLTPEPLRGPQGASFLLHPFTLHGTMPWSGDHAETCRPIAFFRPEYKTAQDWLHAP